MFINMPHSFFPSLTQFHPLPILSPFNPFWWNTCIFQQNKDIAILSFQSLIKHNQDDLEDVNNYTGSFIKNGNILLITMII